MAIPEKVAQMIGQPLGEPAVYEVERGAIRRFCDAVDDFNPLHRDVEYAKRSKYGEITAPVGFFGWGVKGGTILDMLGSLIATAMETGYPGLLDAALEYEPFVPIRDGDILTCFTKVVDIPEKATKSGKSMLLPTVEFNFLNQNGDKALAMRMSLIFRQV
jgi:acyl dehydratase